jgi:hypothetical protein
MGLAAALCLSMAGAVPIRIETDHFQLSWTHSTEQVEWQEEWKLSPTGLRPVLARVKGNGPGMEPPDGARREGGWWVYVPQIAEQRTVILAASAFTTDYRLCSATDCRPLSDWLRLKSETGGPVTLAVCSER